MRFGVLCIVLVLIAFDVHALAITNLHKESQQVTVDQYGQAKNVTIAPGQTWRTSGRTFTLRKIGQPDIRAETLDEYVIWPSGRMGLQRRDSQRRHGNGHKF